MTKLESKQLELIYLNAAKIHLLLHYYFLVMNEEQREATLIEMCEASNSLGDAFIPFQKQGYFKKNLIKNDGK